jgi:hypothetical protein
MRRSFKSLSVAVVVAAATVGVAGQSAVAQPAASGAVQRNR